MKKVNQCAAVNSMSTKKCIHYARSLLRAIIKIIVLVGHLVNRYLFTHRFYLITMSVVTLIYLFYHYFYSNLLDLFSNYWKKTSVDCQKLQKLSEGLYAVKGIFYIIIIRLLFYIFIPISLLISFASFAEFKMVM